MSTNKPWYTEEAGFFGEAYIAEYRAKLDAKAKREVDLIERLLKITDRPSTVLDIPCGYGRHALELARRGHCVTGIDLNRGFLELATETARREAIAVELLQADMRSLAYIKEFDVAFNFFTSIGYFESLDDDLLVLGSIARALKQGGRFLLDTVNPAWRLANLKATERRTLVGGSYVIASQSFDADNRVLSENRTVHEPDGATRILPTVRTRLYTQDELIGMGSRVGLEPEASNMTNDHSRRILLVFIKK